MMVDTDVAEVVYRVELLDSVMPDTDVAEVVYRVELLDSVMVDTDVAEVVYRVELLDSVGVGRTDEDVYRVEIVIIVDGNREAIIEIMKIKWLLVVVVVMFVLLLFVLWNYLSWLCC